MVMKVYACDVRYADGGGVGPAGRLRREQVRLEAARLLADGWPVAEVAQALEVSTKSVYTWRRAWRADGEAGLASRGPSGPRRRLSDRQLDRLRARLEAGPAAAGWTEDQRGRRHLKASEGASRPSSSLSENS